jgi:hypothetical protein
MLVPVGLSPLANSFPRLASSRPLRRPHGLGVGKSFSPLPKRIKSQTVQVSPFDAEKGVESERKMTTPLAVHDGISAQRHFVSIRVFSAFAIGYGGQAW